MSDKKKNESSPFAGALADKLKDLDIDTSAKEKQQAEDESEPKKAPEARRKNASSAEASSPESAQQDQPELSDEELFRQAFQNVDRETIERAHRPPPQQQVSVDREEPADAEPTDGDRADGIRKEGARAREKEPAPPQQKPLTERDLFEKAVEELEPGDVYSGKFHGKGPELPPEPEQAGPELDAAPGRGTTEPGAPVSEEEAREAVAEMREIRQFERAVGPVDKKNERRQKYRKPVRPAPEDHVRQVASFRSDSPEDMVTPPLPKAGEGLNNVGPLSGAQKDMLGRYKKRSRRREVPEINVRGDSVEDALRQIELFVHQQWKDKAHFVRIIHGRGLQSDGDPVLKPAVLRWLEGPGYRYIKGYVPEVNSVGDYGSVIAELVRQE